MHLLFDLDGTLTDSSTGIVRCLNHAVIGLGCRPVPAERLRPMIGTPLTAIFRTVLHSDDVRALDHAVEMYRERFNTIGMFENSLFPGVLEALDGLSGAGHLLQVITAKPVVTAERVLEHFDIARYFAAVHGPDLADRTCNKADLVAAALSTAGGHQRDALVIGDRADDIHAARQHDVRAVAAGWGYGTHDELLAAEPEYFAPTIAQLVAWVQTAGTAYR